MHPSSVEAIIFDVDGTLYNTALVSIEAVKLAVIDFNTQYSLDIPIPDEEYIKKIFGEPVEVCARMILSDGHEDKMEYLYTRIGEHEQRLIHCGQGSLFPQVLQTLNELKERGYRIGYYSNGTENYFYTLMEVFGLGELAEFKSCIGEHPGKTKTQLLQYVLENMNVENAAVVGDRYHDVHSARECGQLSIGALYGFGGDEMKAADHTIQEFKELLDIFPGK